MITDRKKFYFRHPGVKVKFVQWCNKGQTKPAYIVNKPMCVNAYAGLTKHGVTKLHMVAVTSKKVNKHKNKKGEMARNITASEYREVLLSTLLPEGNRSFSQQGASQWVLQQDNDPTRKSAAEAALKQYNGKHKTKVTVLEGWPPNNPDLSPIENLWDIVQRRVDEAGCANFAEFQARLQKEWMQVSKETCRKLMNSIRHRLCQCIERASDRTRY